MKTNTPLTDKRVFTVKTGQGCMEKTQKVVTAGFARKLERKLMEITNKCDWVEKALTSESE